MRALQSGRHRSTWLLVWRSGSSGSGVGFVPVRKPGKLPRETISELTTWNTAPISWKSTLMPSNGRQSSGGGRFAGNRRHYRSDVKLIRRLGGEVADAAFIINRSILAANSVSKNRALPATALPVPGPLIIVSLALLTLRAAQMCIQPRRSDGAVLALPLRESPSSVSEPANELSGLSPKMAPQTFADVVGQEHVLTALANGCR